MPATNLWVENEKSLRQPMPKCCYHPALGLGVNTLRPRQNGRRFADDTFKRIFLNENVRISIKISLKFVPKGPINNNPSLVQIMAWRRPGDKPLSEAMVVSLPTHICVTRPQWVKKTVSSALLFFQIFVFVEKLVTSWIAYSYLTGVTAP